MGNTFSLYNKDCIVLLKELKDNSIDSVVTDPPYGLSNHSTADITEALTAWLSNKEYKHQKNGFMQNAWDSFVPGPEVWKEVYRVLKPGGHILCFAGSRTMDLMSMAIRLSGFELRDNLGYANTGNAPLMAWCYSQGFPKSHNISIALNKNKPNSEEAKQWAGWGTALKPAFEPIILARKPIEKTVANNVLVYGTGGINIDGCRVPVDPIIDHSQLRTMNRNIRENDGWGMTTVIGDTPNVINENGRFPSNLLLEKSPEIIALFPDSNGQQGNVLNQNKTRKSSGIYGDMPPASNSIKREETNKSASRYYNQFSHEQEDFETGSKILFYIPKANKKDREEGLNQTDKKSNIHPTVKPTALIQHLVRIITPKNGVCLDIFMGSGTTGKACALENVNFIGCEISTEYFNIAQDRINFFYQKKKQLYLAKTTC